MEKRIIARIKYLLFTRVGEIPENSHIFVSDFCSRSPILHIFTWPSAIMTLVMFSA